MAKTPRKPAGAKPARAKSADAETQKPVGPATRKVSKAVGVEKLDEGERQTYKAKEKEIDLALHHCLGHFGKLQPSEVQVVIKLLKPYYQTYGGHKTSGGMKFK